ncbi:amidase [Bacillaceae bacterium IKA-2]|nr:amidase [Bacillaceae bacterium IKA-2]
MKIMSLFISLLIVGLIVLFISYFILPENKQPELATWLWDTKLLEADTTEIIQFVEVEKITSIYLQYSQEIDFDYYQQFISVMTAMEVNVYALDGSPTWAVNRSEEDTFLAWLALYQRSSIANQQFKGIHLDVEPYLQAGWETNQAEIIVQYQAMVKRVLKQSKELNLTFAIDIPFWFDEIDFNNQFGEGNLAEWIIKTVDEITIMAYRNHAIGEGGIIEISQNEIDWADKEKKKLIIAVETAPLPESYTSFNGTSIEEMNAELEIVKKFYLKNKSFSGVAIHHLISWQELKQP